MIIDEAFLSSAVSNLPSIAAGDVTQHIRYDGNASLGFDLVECLTTHQGDLSYLRNKDIGAFEFNAVSLEALNPHPFFSADTTHSRNVRSAKLYKTLTKLLEIVAREVEDHGKNQFGQRISFKSNKKARLCGLFCVVL